MYFVEYTSFAVLHIHCGCYAPYKTSRVPTPGKGSYRFLIPMDTDSNLLQPEKQCSHPLQFKATTTRNALYEQGDTEDGDVKEHSDRFHSSKKARKGNTWDRDGGDASRKGKDGRGKKSKKPWGTRKKEKHRDASSDEEEAVQGPQLTNIMQIMEQQQR